MNRNTKILTSLSMVISLLILTMVPAWGATNYYSTKTSNNTTLIVYSTGNRYYYVYQPTTTTVKPSVPTTTKPSTPTTNPTNPTNPTPTPQPSTGISAEESKMVNLVNQARISQGIKPLTVNSQLVNLARKKSQDMVAKNYFSHNSPTYGSPFDMIKNAGITYRTAGENLAGAATTESAHQNLMNSSGHRANILNPSFTEIGIGIASGSIYGNIYTQLFIGR
ncbi:MAG TPA: CAP domain-containing protein [Bacillota bacterium]|nr:CAP domain-containing protein [Bacillota bacterium]HOL10130.1 CAP domain-containing protein [Bacillota bacterium]HPO97874.1 CAP domain-containing protein [Bacillota bacterium]